MVTSPPPMRSPLPFASLLAVCLASPLACGTTESSGSTDTTSSETTADGATTTSESSSGGDESSTGGIPEACPDVALETGIVGRTDQRTCDILAECVMPQTGVALAAYAENPQIGGSDSEPGTLDPGIAAIAALNSGVGGRFEFLLPAGSYHVCASAGGNLVFCSAAIVLSDDDPVVFASYETGNGSSWSVISCGL